MSWERHAAGQPEIIRAHQKDEYFQTILKNKIAEVVLSLFGPKALIKYEKEILCFTRLGYLFFTTALGLQTVGEEYCHLLQVDGAKLKIPNAKRRNIMLLLQCVWPLVLGKLVTFIQKKRIAGTDTGETLFQMSLKEIVHKASTVLNRIHLALFYIDGRFYDLSKRILGIRYVIIRDFLKSTTAVNSYQILGKVLLFQLSTLVAYNLIKMLSYARNSLTAAGNGSPTKRNDSSHRPTHMDYKCPLCLSSASDLTATQCGHLFCWYCINNWAKTNHDCPVCRKEIRQSSLIYICQYDA